MKDGYLLYTTEADSTSYAPQSGNQFELIDPVVEIQIRKENILSQMKQLETKIESTKGKLTCMFAEYNKLSVFLIENESQLYDQRIGQILTECLEDFFPLTGSEDLGRLRGVFNDCSVAHKIKDSVLAGWSTPDRPSADLASAHSKQNCPKSMLDMTAHGGKGNWDWDTAVSVWAKKMTLSSNHNLALVETTADLNSEGIEVENSRSMEATDCGREHPIDEFKKISRKVFSIKKGKKGNTSKIAVLGSAIATQLHSLVVKQNLDLFTEDTWLQMHSDLMERGNIKNVPPAQRLRSFFFNDVLSQIPQIRNVPENVLQFCKHLFLKYKVASTPADVVIQRKARFTADEDTKICKIMRRNPSWNSLRFWKTNVQYFPRRKAFSLRNRARLLSYKKNSMS